MNPYRPFHVRLVARERLSPSFVRITLGGDDLGACAPTLLDQRVKLLLGAPEALEALSTGEDWYAAWLAFPDADRPAFRTYTLVAVRPAADGAGEVDIDVAVHPLGDEPAPGMRFALNAPLGAPTVLVAADVTRAGHDTVGLAWRPGAARDVLLVGDETALPAIANIAPTLPRGATGRIVVEVPCVGDVRRLDVPDGVVVDWRVRARGERAVGVLGRPPGRVADDDALPWDEAEGSAGRTDARYGWVAGEAGWVRGVRVEARDAGVPKGELAFMGYWKRGVAGS